MLRKCYYLLIVPLLFLLIAGCAEKQEIKTIGVNALATDPTSFKGQIAVAAVVQKVDQGNSSISIIDEQEYATCGLNPCNAAGIIPLYLPTSGKTASGVTYTGNLPKLEDKVTVIGEVKTNRNNMYFDVDRIVQGATILIQKSK